VYGLRLPNKISWYLSNLVYEVRYWFIIYYHGKCYPAYLRGLWPTRQPDQTAEMGPIGSVTRRIQSLHVLLSCMLTLVLNFSTQSTRKAKEISHNEQVCTTSKRSEEARKEAVPKAITEGSKILAPLDCCSLLYSKEVNSNQSPPKVQHPRYSLRQVYIFWFDVGFYSRSRVSTRFAITSSSTSLTRKEQDNVSIVCGSWLSFSMDHGDCSQARDAGMPRCGCQEPGVFVYSSCLCGQRHNWFNTLSP